MRRTARRDPRSSSRPTTSSCRARPVPPAGKRITALQNIPVVSWLALGGKCASCKAPISARYPIVEVLGGLLAAYAIWRFGATPRGVAACVLLWTLLALTMIDFDTQLLPDDITLPLLWAGLIVNLWGLFAPLSDAVIGAVAGYLSLWTIYWLFKLIRGKEGHGLRRLQAARPRSAPGSAGRCCR